LAVRKTNKETRKVAKIQIIVGSVMGTAERVANYLCEQYSAHHSLNVNMHANAADLLRDESEFLLFCTSNTGHGDLPDNILPLFQQLTDNSPDIAGRHYALINIGDSSYPAFGEAGLLLKKALDDADALELVPSLLIDTSIERYPQKTARDWFQNQLNTALSKTSG
jgi:MioC protein